VVFLKEKIDFSSAMLFSICHKIVTFFMYNYCNCISSEENFAKCNSPEDIKQYFGIESNG